MEGFYVHPEWFIQIENDEQNYSTKLTDLGDRIQRVKRELPGVIGNQGNIFISLENQSKQIVAYKDGMSKLFNTLLYSESRYKNIEKGISENSRQCLLKNTETPGNAMLQSLDSLSDVLISEIPNFGLLGNTVNIMQKLAKGEISKKDWLSIAKSGTTMLGEAASYAWKDDDAKNWWSLFLGDMKTQGEALSKYVGDGAKVTRGNIWGASWKKWADGYSFKNAINLGDKLKVATKWASGALTVVQEGIENFNDYQEGEMSAGRMVAETILESGGSILTGAATVALAGVMLGPGAPVVVVTAVGAGIKWVADGICEKFFGKDLVETVSDGVLDAAKEGINLGVKAFESGVNGVKKAAKTVAKWFSFL